MKMDIIYHSSQHVSPHFGSQFCSMRVLLVRSSTAAFFLSANVFVVLIAATSSVSSVLNRWRTYPSENDMRFRIFDLNHPADAPIIKIIFLRNQLVQLTGPDQAQQPHGNWNSSRDTIVDVQFMLRNNPIELQFQLIDHTDSFQDIRTAELLLIPWVEAPQIGPARVVRPR